MKLGAFHVGINNVLFVSFDVYGYCGNIGNVPTLVSHAECEGIFAVKAVIWCISVCSCVYVSDLDCAVRSSRNDGEVKNLPIFTFGA